MRAIVRPASLNGARSAAWQDDPFLWQELAIESPDAVILQAGVVPYRKYGDEVEICLITSLKKRRWIFPKGIIEPGDSCEETALKEAAEEAGLQGRIVGEPLGQYDDFKWGGPLQVTMLLMEATDWDDDWPESELRDRCWVSPTRAAQLLSKASLRRFFQIAMSNLGIQVPSRDPGE